MCEPGGVLVSRATGDILLTRVHGLWPRTTQTDATARIEKTALTR
jgi:hypothetical protein